MTKEVQEFLDQLTEADVIALRCFLPVEGGKIIALLKDTGEKSIKEIKKNKKKFKEFLKTYVRLTHMYG